MKKILIISPVPTHPPFAGHSASILEYSKYLINKGNEVHFFYISTHVNESIESMSLFWGDKLTILKSKRYSIQLKLIIKLRFYLNKKKEYKVDDWCPWGLKKRIRKLQEQENFDIIWINYVWLSKLFEGIKVKTKVLDTHDLFWERNKRVNGDWFSTSYKQEKKALDRADYILAVQDEEAEIFSKMTSKKVITTYRYFSLRETKSTNCSKLLFFASGNKSNIDSITWFIENVFSNLIKIKPDTELLIGGSICDSLKVNESKNINILGKFEDLMDFYKLGDIAINPVYTGTGLKIKLFEALSFGKILITHPHNLIGIPFTENIPVFSATSKEEYTSTILTLLNDIDLRKSLKTRINEYMNSYNNLVEERLKQFL